MMGHVTKIRNRGDYVMYVEYSLNHTGNVYRLLKISTKRIVLSRDTIWLDRFINSILIKKEKEDYISIREPPQAEENTQPIILLDVPTDTKVEEMDMEDDDNESTMVPIKISRELKSLRISYNPIPENANVVYDKLMPEGLHLNP